MRTSSDYFDQDPNSFENLDNTFVPRPTVPLFADKISLKPNLPPPPKPVFKAAIRPPVQPPRPKLIIPAPKPRVNYPVFTPPPKPVENTALEQIQLQIQQEVSDLKKHKPTLDQLIQNALKQKIQHDSQIAKQKIVTIKKTTTPAPNPYLNQKQPFQKPARQLWWPSQEEVNFQQPTAQTPIIKIPEPVELKTDLAPTPVKGANIQDQPIVPKEKELPKLDTLVDSIKETFTKQPSPKPVAAPKPVNPPLKTVPTLAHAPLKVAKTAFHVSFNLLNYLLFTVNPEIDPYNDTHRQYIVFGIKAGAYITTLVGIFELLRNLNIGLTLNGQFEVVSIFLICSILFFFGENLNILFKPINPYQIHEVV